MGLREVGEKRHPKQRRAFPAEHSRGGQIDFPDAPFCIKRDETDRREIVLIGQDRARLFAQLQRAHQLAVPRFQTFRLLLARAPGG